MKLTDKQIEHYTENPILDKDGKPLTPEECWEYECDLFDMGIPMSKEQAKDLWAKWGLRLGIPEIK